MMPPRVAALALAAMLLALATPSASAGAEDPNPDRYDTTFANIVGIIAAGGATWYVSYPTDVPVTGTYNVAISVSTTAAATASLAVTAGSFAGSGCSVGAFVADTAATSFASGYLPITTTGAYCFGSVRLTLAASSTTITAIRASFQIASDTVNVAGSLSVTNSGGQSLTITSWPSLLATLSGGVTVTDDANGWAIHQDALTGTVNVVNSGGQSLAVTSWPQLQALLSGGVTVTDDANGWAMHQDQACGATIRCLSDTNSTLTIGTANVNSTTPDKFRVEVENKSFDDFVPLGLLLVAMVYAWLRLHRTGWKWLFPLVIFVLAVLSAAAVFITTNKPLAAAVVVIVSMLGLMTLINGWGLGRARE